MDSRPETLEHIAKVRVNLMLVLGNIIRRAFEHDASKLETPEKEIFDRVTERLRSLTYGSPEYMEQLKELQPALQHHYFHNRHHPEHHAEGIRGMSLLDIVEMLCDWEAATKRHADGDLRKSIEINQGRFGYSDELKRILINTAVELGMI